MVSCAAPSAAVAANVGGTAVSVPEMKSLQQKPSRIPVVGNNQLKSAPKVRATIVPDVSVMTRKTSCVQGQNEIYMYIYANDFHVFGAELPCSGSGEYSYVYPDDIPATPANLRVILVFRHAKLNKRMTAEYSAKTQLNPWRTLIVVSHTEISSSLTVLHILTLLERPFFVQLPGWVAATVVNRIVSLS